MKSFNVYFVIKTKDIYTITIKLIDADIDEDEISWLNGWTHTVPTNVDNFDVIGWSTSERSEEEFKPTKLNGVCRLPEYLRSEISTETWDMYIDDTFEIQIKTMFFEGWHEIEHDMRYKDIQNLSYLQ